MIKPFTDRLVLLAGVVLLCAWLVPAQAGALDEDIARLQHGWATAYYQLPDKQKAASFQTLAADAQAVIDKNPGRSEPMIWHAIILSSDAKFQSGLGALTKAKQAREELLAAEKIDATVLHGALYTTLGTLYAKAPGWPLAFGDKKQAKVYLQKALAINPDGIDPSFFYGELLADQGEKTEARQYLEKALAAAPRPGREDADAGRRSEIQAVLAKLS